MKDRTLDIGTVWGFVIDTRSWVVSHVVAQVGKQLQDRAILISRRAFQKPLLPDRVFSVSLSEDPSDVHPPNEPADTFNGPYVAKLEISLEPPCGWALRRPMPLPAFPAPMISSSYRKATGCSSVEGDNDCDAPPKSCWDIIGCRVEAVDCPIGVIDDLLLDDDCWSVRYLVMDRGKWFSDRKVILSTDWIKLTNDDSPKCFVDLPAKAVQNGPAYDPARPMSRELEVELFDHYGRKPYWVS